jgi:DNA-binding NarL/FixJ family response regulator
MADASSPRLLVAGGDPKRLEWLSHHITSQWPEARVWIVPPSDAASLGRVIDDREPDAVMLHVDFGTEALAQQGLERLAELRRLRESLYCIVLAENGDELAVLRTLKSGARDYLPQATLTRDMLLTAVYAAAEHRQELDRLEAERLEAERPDHALLAPPTDTPAMQVPGYAIVKEIATSNFSVVYLARSERLRRNVVLKALSLGTSVRELEDAERFQREYEIISSIRHPAIAEIYDFGTLPEHLYLAMEYFPCGELRDRLRNPLSTEESLYYLRAIATALRGIHMYGVLHRDLKPANVMLREDNSPVLIDFGLARRAMDDPDMTGIGTVLGSPYYISPEQALGQRVDARTDLYSLGVIFYEMLMGQKPYQGRSAIEIMKQHAAAPIPRLPEHLAEQQWLLDRLMAKEVEARFASAEELLTQLDSGATASHEQP